MGAFRAQVKIAAPPDVVFDVFADADRVTEWFPGVRRVDAVSGPIESPGTTYTLRFGWPLRAECEVVEVDRPWFHHRRFTTNPGNSPGHARMRLERDGDGTRVELTGDYTMPMGAAGRALDRMFARTRNGRARGELEGLKEAAEAEAGRLRQSRARAPDGAAATS